MSFKTTFKTTCKDIHVVSEVVEFEVLKEKVRIYIGRKMSNKKRFYLETFIKKDELKKFLEKGLNNEE